MDNETRSQKRTLIILIVAVVVVILIGLTLAYCVMASHHKGRFPDKTYINGVDVSGMTAQRAKNELADEVENYTLTIAERGGTTETISGEEIGLTYVDNGDVDRLLSKYNPYKWFFDRFRTDELTAATDSTSDSAKAEQAVRGLSCFRNYTPVQNAGIVDNGTEFVVQEAVEGNQLNTEAAVSAILTAITAVLGGVLSVVSGFDVGGLVSFLSYAKQISMPVNQISMQMTTVLAAMAGAERIFEVMDAEPEIDEGKVTLVQAHWDADHNLCEGREPAGQKEHWAWKVPENGDFRLVALRGDVRFNDVCFGYVPNKEVLHHINVYAKPGQKIAFVGSTGAGKTTITNLINRFYEIQSGTITYDGIDVKDIEKDSLRHSLGAVLQDTHLFTGTVMDNIRYGRLDATDEECIAAAKAANAHSFIRRLPDGYQTMVTGDGGNLSQGQRQLLAIARAAVADPPVMVLDEATSSIDTRTEALISKGMDTLMENRTVFVIAHRLSTIRNANAIAVIEAGEIIEKGNHHELLDQKGRYYQLYTGQFQLS